MVRILKASMCVVLVWAFHPGSVWAAQPEAPDFSDPSALVVGLYTEISRTAERAPDWDVVRRHFHPAAVIVLRASRDETRLMSVDEFIQDFVAFYDRIGPDVEFTETVVSVVPMEYGNVAHVYLVYEAAVGGSDRPPQRGLDSWHLMFRDDRWWIVSVVNESEVSAGTIPGAVFGD